MAGDWIKMRVNLVSHPKVLALAEILADDDEYQEWSTMAGFVPSIGGTRDDSERDYQASLRVTRYVTVCALLRFWGYANEHAKDEFIGSLRLRDIDDVVQVPGFGSALQAIGWAEYDAERRGLSLPNFNEYNTSGNERSAGAKSAAQRQKEYRDRKKSVESDVTRDEESDVTSNRREEKNREEKKKEDKAQAPFDLPSWIPMEAWEGYAEMRGKIRKPMTDRAKRMVVKALDEMRLKGIDIAQALDNSTRKNWLDVYEPKDAPKSQPGDTSWLAATGFANIAEAQNARCHIGNADQFRDGKRLEAHA